MPEPAYSTQPEVRDATTCTGPADAGEREPSPPCGPVIDTRTDGDRVIVTIRGELDLGVEQRLHRCLRSALSRSARGIDLDLNEVAFCDCSALNVLLTVRRQALAESKTVGIRAAGPAVERMLQLTDVRALFTAPEEEPAAFPAAREPAEPRATDDELRVEVVQLRRAMRTRPTIDLARGLLMAAFGLGQDEALTALVIASQNTNTKLHTLAGDLVGAVKGPPLPEVVQRELSAAVARAAALTEADHLAARDAAAPDLTPEVAPDLPPGLASDPGLAPDFPPGFPRDLAPVREERAFEE
ncbi:ANTAR domain-containing protein [Streptomyces sp. NPDC005574]|uniref:ANTAR domain-containing protein n=1 Tax=Streptomyces sp. NPDC005574 TaxID=3156891 RepID=UPI0033BBD5CA